MRTRSNNAALLVAALLLAACGYGADDEAGSCGFVDCGGGVQTAPRPGEQPAPGPLPNTGNGQVTMPAGTEAVQIQASLSAGTDLFTAQAGDDLLMLQFLNATSSPQSVSGTYAVPPGAVVRIEAGAATWLVTPLKVPAAGATRVNVSGIGASVVPLPARQASYEISASSEAVMDTISVALGPRYVFLAAVGAQATPARYQGVHLLSGPGALEIRAGTTVRWTLRELP